MAGGGPIVVRAPDTKPKFLKAFFVEPSGGGGDVVLKGTLNFFVEWGGWGGLVEETFNIFYQ